MTENNKKNLRKIKNFLPAIFQTHINEKFFNSSVDQVFQPQNIEELLGYIGKITSWYDYRKDFYIKEKDSERQFYQLSSMMITKDLLTGDYIKQLTYTDLINYIRFKGGNVKNHQRLFETDYYSWCPPIDLDKFLNYRNYYWVPLGPKPIEIDAVTNLDDAIGSENYSINNNGDIINFSSGLRIKPKNDINNYYNNKIFIVEGVGREIILVEDALSVYGWDLNFWDVDFWDEIGDLSFIPDYITIERGAEDKNQWSLSNRWFHKDVITNFFDPNLFKIRAARPIIEFEKNIELWNYGSYSRGHVDIIVDNCENFFNLVNGRQPGMPVGPVLSPGGLPTIGCGIEVDEPTPTWPLSNLGYSQLFYTDSNGYKLQLRDGLLLLMPVDNNPFIKNKILKITGIKDFNQITLQVVNNGLNTLGDPEYNERILYKTLTGKRIIYRYDGKNWIKGQSKNSINQAPLFQLYDVNGVSLDDPNYYPDSDFKFKGNKIFSYKEDDNFSIDKVLNLKVKRNKLNEFVFENNLFNDRYFYIDPVTKNVVPINGYHFYKITNYIKNESRYLNNWNLVPTKLNQFYVFSFDNHKGQSEFYLTIKPSLPLVARDNTETKSLIVKINNKEKILGVDYSYINSENKIILTNPLNDGEILEIYVISDEIPTNNNGIYEIPLNLQSNPNNEEITEAGTNQLFEHFLNNIKNQKNITGNIFGKNNYRDTKKEKFYGNKILQHDAPLLRLMLIASDRDLDLVDAIRYVRREYVRFRNKFIKKISSLSLNSNNPQDWFETALKEINLGKNEESPFRNSGVGYALTPSPAPTYIPPSPAYLGITKVYKPEIYVDDTYTSLLTVLRCHDGSLMPTYGDFRDQVLLYFEERIYDSIPQKFKNDYLPLLSEYDVIPGKFRKTDYSLEEINNILQNNYELWLVDNGINNTKNNYLEIFDEKSINYTNSVDYSGEKVHGSWRALFKWFYDTDTPHLTPWEMLGFGKKPDWWDNEYGSAPYTSGNFKLWNDLRQGFIRQGPRAGYDKRFERPDLLDIIPVDSIGSLKSPLSIGLVKNRPSDVLSGKDWDFGEFGPIETIWRKSSEFVFDTAIMLFLTKPARFTHYNWDCLSSKFVYENNTRQFIYSNYRKRTRNIEEVVHGETREIVNNFAKNYEFDIYDNLVRRFGYQQFIADYLKNKGKDITINFGNYLRGTNVVLGYRAASFTDTDYTFIESESFGRLPKENYKVKLYNSNSIKETFYGGVIIEKTPSGFKVFGYDVINPYFKVIPSDIHGRKIKIGLGNKENVVREWNENTKYYMGDIVVLNENKSYYQCIVDHISKDFFDPSKWKEIKNLPKEYEISAIKYLDAKHNEEKKILYGTEFFTTQDVFNFLIEYERYLKKEGFIFDNYNSLINENIDFTWSGKEFLSWVLLKPLNGEILTLSPLAEKIKFSTNFGNIAPVEEIIQNVYSILNRTGVKIDPKDTIVTRLDDYIEIVPYDINNQDTLIYAIRLYVTSVEHVYLFDNETIFDDIIYDPLFNIRVDRLRINLVRVANWRGRYEAAGYIIDEDKLLPNFDKLVDQLRYIFDIEKSNLVEKRWRDYGSHLIGYQPRNYLNKLIISDKSQINFYQGMIRQKGTKSSLQKLLRSEYINKISDMLFYEEWLFRIGHYGNYEKKPYLEIIFKREDFKENPVIIDFPIEELPNFITVGTSSQAIYQGDFFYNKDNSKLYLYNSISSNYEEISFDDFINYFIYDNPFDNILKIPSFVYENKIVGSSNKWLSRPDRFVTKLENWLFLPRKSEFFNFKDLPNAGYIKLDEYTVSVFNHEGMKTLYDEKIKNKTLEIKDGDRLWIYDTSLNLNSKFNQTLNNFYDSWSIYRISKYSRKINSIVRKENNDLAVSFVYSDLFSVSGNNKFNLNIDQVNINEILVSFEENENKTKLEEENFKIYGYVYDIDVSSLSIVSGQTIIITYSDNILTNSLTITEFNDYINGAHIFKTIYVPNELESISYGFVSSASATYVGNLTAYSVFVSSVTLTGESVWISYSPIFENIERDRIYTEKFISDGINNIYTLTFLPNISSIKVRKGFEIEVSADKYVEEKNPFIEVSSNISDKIWIEYIAKINDENYIELFEKSSANQLVRIKNEPHYDSVNVYVGSARETVFLNPNYDFTISGLNTLVLNVSAPNNANIFINYLIKDPKTENKPINYFTGNGFNNVFNLSDPVSAESNILVFVDGKLRYNILDYTISSQTTFLTFNVAPANNSNIWVYYVSETENLYDQTTLSGQREFTISLNNISTFGCLLTINNEILKPLLDFTVSGNKVNLNKDYPINSVARIRYINPVPALREKDILLFDYSNTDDFITIEGFREIKSVNQLGEVIFEDNTSDFNVFSDETVALNQPKGVYSLKEIRFINYKDYFDTVKSVYYGSIFGKPKKGEIFYIDDARLKNENNREKYYRAFSLPNDGWLSVLDENDIINNTKRLQKNKIETSLVYNAEIYDYETKNTTIFELYDPYKGIIPGIADKEIFYKLDYDPAVYNTGDNSIHNISNNNFWSREQVGRVWWDLRTVRFIDYEIDEIDYRRANWGKIAPGTSIDVYEWVRSELSPSEYNTASLTATFSEDEFSRREQPTGTTYYQDNTPYTVQEEYDKTTGQNKKYYYFWVKNKITIPNVGFRNLSVFDIAKIIENPTQRGILWFSPISENSVIIANAFEFLGNNTSLKINWFYDHEIKNKGNFHKQWLLGREYDPNWIIDDLLYTKFVDSLVGYNILNEEVPDPNLKEHEKYGNLIRPRQSWFKNRNLAVFNFVEFVNKIFEQTNLSLKLNGFNSLYVYDKEPIDADFIVNDIQQRDYIAQSNIINVGQTVLVKKNLETSNFWTLWKLVDNSPFKFILIDAQKYDTADFIELTDYYSEEVNKNLIPEKIYNDISDRNTALSQGLILENEIIFVRDVAGFWEWQKYENNFFKIVARQKSTIKLSDKFYKNNNTYGINEDWNSLDLDELNKKIKNRDGRLELRKLLEIFKNNYFDNNEILNRIFFSSVRYSISENKINDWVVKSSYVLFGGLTELVTQEEILRPSLFESIYDYLVEIKPYHTKFRDFYRRISSSIDEYNLKVSDYEYGTDEYNSNKTRKIKIKQNFDRVSCSFADEEPLMIRIIANGINSSYILNVDNIIITTVPNLPDYKVYKTDGIQVWDSNNIEYVAIKNNTNLTFTLLSDNDWNISKIQYIETSGSSSHIVNALRINLNLIPNNGEIIEIKRKLHASERLNRYYQVISTLINGKPVQNIIPEKSPKLISGCDFKGTQVEGGAYINSIADFQLTIKDSKLKSVWDIQPDENYIKDNLLPATLPNGDSITAFISSYGADWLEIYYDTFANSYPNDSLIVYLNNFYNYYAWDLNQWDGDEGVLSSDYATSIASGNSTLYDNILESGTQLSGFPGYIDFTTPSSSWTTISGYSLAVVVEGNKFVQPYLGPNRPEELVLNRYYDPLILDNYLRELPGAAIVKEFKFKGIINTGFEIKFDIIPQSRESVFLFVNGILLDENVDYIIDWKKQKIIYIGPTINDNETQLLLKIYSTGGNKIIHTAYLRVSDATTGIYGYTLKTDNDLKYSLSASNIFGTINGYIVSALNVINGEIIFDLSGVFISADSNVVINIYDSSDFVKIRTTKYVVTSGSSLISLIYRSGSEIPHDQSTMVFLSGLRMHGPDHKYFLGDGSNNYFDINANLSGLNYYVYINDNLKVSGLDYILTGTNDNIIAFFDVPKENELITVLIDNGEYLINSSGNIVLSTSFTTNNTFKIITFNENKIQGIKTEKFIGNSEGKYQLDLVPTNNNVFWASINGLNNIYGIDFKIESDLYGYDEGLFGIQDFGEGPEYSTLNFNSDHSGMSVYISYGIKNERTEPIAYRMFRPSYDEKEDIRISNNNILYLKTEISAHTTSFEVYENYKYIPGLRENLPLTKPDPYHNQPGIIWINGERIEYWKLSETKYDSENNRYWTISSIVRRTKETSRGTDYKKETYWFAGDGSTTSFNVPSPISLSAGNIIVSIYDNILEDNIWDDIFGWDYSPYDSIPENIEKNVINIETSATISGLYYKISANNIIFNQPIPESNLNSILFDAFSSSAFYPVKNIKVDVIIYDWTTSNLEHPIGSLVFNGNTTENIPGYYNPNYNENTLGLQNRDDVQSKFLSNNINNNINP